jgi:hypothetical protein
VERNSEDVTHMGLKHGSEVLLQDQDGLIMLDQGHCYCLDDTPSPRNKSDRLQDVAGQLQDTPNEMKCKVMNAFLPLKALYCLSMVLVDLDSASAPLGPSAY